MFNSQQRERYLDTLTAAITQMSLDVSEAQRHLLIDYLALLAKWNQSFNLTAVRDPDEMLHRHLVDSLSIAPYLDGSRIIDVGTGPGLPGIPMAILYPEKKFVLLDSNIKKTRFLTQCLIELKLMNVRVCHDRVGATRFDQGFDQVLSRAFTALDNMVKICKHLLTDDGRFLAMKGLDPIDEQSNMDPEFVVEDTISLSVPGCEGQRHLIIIGKSHS